jgi:hypothetical protein
MDLGIANIFIMLLIGALKATLVYATLTQGESSWISR